MANTTLNALRFLVQDNLTGEITGSDIDTITVALWENAILGDSVPDGNIPMFATDSFGQGGTMVNSLYNFANMPLSDAALTEFGNRLVYPAGGSDNDVLIKSSSTAVWLTPTSSMVGLGNVEDYSADDLPLSLASIAALALKQDLTAVPTLSDALATLDRTFTFGDAGDTSTTFDTAAGLGFILSEDVLINANLAFGPTTLLNAPEYTTAGLPAAVPGNAGAVVYDTDVASIKYSNGANWVGADFPAPAPAASITYNPLLAPSGLTATDVQAALDEYALGGVTIGEAGFIFKEDTTDGAIGAITVDNSVNDYFYVSNSAGLGGLRLKQDASGTSEISLSVDDIGGNVPIITYNQELATPAGYLNASDATANPANTVSVMSWDGTGTSFLEGAMFLKDIGVTGIATFTEPPVLPVYTVDTLPTPSVANTNAVAVVSDAPGGQVVASSDGTKWSYPTPLEVLLETTLVSSPIGEYIADLSPYISDYESFRFELRDVTGTGLVDTKIYAEFGHTGGTIWIDGPLYHTAVQRIEKDRTERNDENNHIKLGDRNVILSIPLTSDFTLIDFSNENSISSIDGVTTYVTTDGGNPFDTVEFSALLTTFIVVDSIKIYFNGAQINTGSIFRIYGRPYPV